MNAKQLIELTETVMHTPVDQVAARYGIDHKEIINELVELEAFPVDAAMGFVAGFLVGAEYASVKKGIKA